jgi:hypothetical protein
MLPHCEGKALRLYRPGSSPTLPPSSPLSPVLCRYSGKVGMRVLRESAFFFCLCFLIRNTAVITNITERVPQNLLKKTFLHEVNGFVRAVL